MHEITTEIQIGTTIPTEIPTETQIPTETPTTIDWYPLAQTVMSAPAIALLSIMATVALLRHPIPVPVRLMRPQEVDLQLQIPLEVRVDVEEKAEKR